MKKLFDTKLKRFLVSLAVTVLFWMLYAVCMGAEASLTWDYEILFLWLAVVFSVLTAGLFFVWLAERLEWRLSPYALFALAMLTAEIAFAAYAVYDLQTSTGFLAGLLGMLILVYVVPAFALFQLIDLIVWLVMRRRRKREPSQ